MKKLLILSIFLVLLLPVIQTELLAKNYPVFTDNRIFKKVDAAIKGYDTVAYFTQEKPVEGKEDITIDYQGVTWRFASTENKALFEKKPEKYAPQYGGYCAYAMSRGDFAKIEPEAWTIIEGKLYLNYNTKIQKEWDEDRLGYIQSANAAWGKVIAK